MTREEKYRKQMKALGIYEDIFEPEISTLCQIERELQMAKKAWSKSAPPGGKPSVDSDLYGIIQKMRAEILQHRDALGLTPKGLHRLRGVQAADGPDQRDLIAAKLDRIADSVAGFDFGGGSETSPELSEILAGRNPFAEMPGFQEAQEISDQMDAEDYDLKKAVAEDMG